MDFAWIYFYFCLFCLDLWFCIDFYWFCVGLYDLCWFICIDLCVCCIGLFWFMFICTGSCEFMFILRWFMCILRWFLKIYGYFAWIYMCSALVGIDVCLFCMDWTEFMHISDWFIEFCMDLHRFMFILHWCTWIHDYFVLIYVYLTWIYFDLYPFWMNSCDFMFYFALLYLYFTWIYTDLYLFCMDLCEFMIMLYWFLCILNGFILIYVCFASFTWLYTYVVWFICILHWITLVYVYFTWFIWIYIYFALIHVDCMDLYRFMLFCMDLLEFMFMLHWFMCILHWSIWIYFHFDGFMWMCPYFELIYVYFA